MNNIKNLQNVIYGRNPVKEALRNNSVISLLLETGFKDGTILEMLKDKNIKIVYKNKSELDSLTNGASHQGIVAEIKQYQYSSLEEIIHKSKKVERPIIVMLDGIEDPHNLGAILRSCDVFGVSGVIIPKHGSVSLNATVAKTSAGAINYVSVAMVSNLNSAIQTLKENGFWIVSSDGSASTNYNDLVYDFPTVLVIGSEGNGVSKLVLKNSDFVVKIQQYGHVNSLNASVATGVILSKIRG